MNRLTSTMTRTICCTLAITILIVLCDIHRVTAATNNVHITAAQRQQQIQQQMMMQQQKAARNQQQPIHEPAVYTVNTHAVPVQRPTPTVTATPQQTGKRKKSS